MIQTYKSKAEPITSGVSIVLFLQRLSDFVKGSEYSWVIEDLGVSK